MNYSPTAPDFEDSNNSDIGELKEMVRELHGTVAELHGTVAELHGTVAELRLSSVNTLKSCSRMSTHIDFVESVWEYLKYPVMRLVTIVNSTQVNLKQERNIKCDLVLSDL
jgi:hypothetical protein